MVFLPGTDDLTDLPQLPYSPYSNFIDPPLPLPPQAVSGTGHRSGHQGLGTDRSHSLECSSRGPWNGSSSWLPHVDIHRIPLAEAFPQNLSAALTVCPSLNSSYPFLCFFVVVVSYLACNHHQEEFIFYLSILVMSMFHSRRQTPQGQGFFSLWFMSGSPLCCLERM